MKEMLAIAEELNDKLTLVYAYTNIGSVYQKRVKSTFGLTIQKNLAVAIEIEDKTGQGYALSNIAGYHTMKKEYDIALQKYDQALEIYKKLGDKQMQVGMYHAIGSTYFFKR